MRPADLWLTGILSALIVLTVLAFYKEFLVLSFDPILAATLRLPARLLDYLLMILIAVVIVVSLQTVGVALMVAMLVTPAATAYLLTHRLPVMMLLAAVIGALAGVVGLYISYYASVASGAAIVLVSTAFFPANFFAGPRPGCALDPVAPAGVTPATLAISPAQQGQDADGPVDLPDAMRPPAWRERQRGAITGPRAQVPVALRPLLLPEPIDGRLGPYQPGGKRQRISWDWSQCSSPLARWPAGVVPSGTPR